MPYDYDAIMRWRDAHREEYNAYHRAYYQAHKAEHHARAEAWRKAHPEYKEKKRAYQREWCKKRKEKANDES